MFNCRKLFSTAFLLAVSFSPCVHAETRGFLTEDEIAQFYEQGYLLKRQCLKSNEMEKLNVELTKVIEHALEELRQSSDQSVSEADQITFMDGSRVVFKRRPDQTLALVRVNGCSGMNPALLDTVRSEKMVRTFFELLGTNDLEHLISQIHPKLPGDKIEYPKHRDIQFRKSFDPEWEDVLGNGSYAICLIPIDKMGPENGGLWVDKNNYPEPQGLEEDRLWLDMEPGDFLFMHPHVYHGSGPNTSSQISRKMLLTGFCAFGANHKAYPGADVNTRLTLDKNDKINLTHAPWSQNATTQPSGGH